MADNAIKNFISLWKLCVMAEKNPNMMTEDEKKLYIQKVIEANERREYMQSVIENLDFRDLNEHE